jgi:ubiquinone/menaquinone biosynthesis C-methylase UbiE
VSYFSLENRVPEVSALEPEVVTWLYDLISQIPLVRTTHRRFITGVLGKGVVQGYALDLGTGPGHVAIDVARRSPELRMIGLDLGAHMIERARRQGARHELNGRSPWLQADGHCLPFADDSLDLVISSFALHHWRDPLEVMNEIARVLRRPRPEAGEAGGGYYIADVCREVSAFQRLIAFASIPAFSLPFGSYWGYGGYYESVRAGYTRDEAQSLLDQSALPPGTVALDSTWFVPVLTITSKGAA